MVVHAALHHCNSPHRALLEMYRVAKKGILSIESKDSYLMKIALKFNLTYRYELPAVYFNDMEFGGLANTNIPNFIYRWTEDEIHKVLNCYAPYAKHKINFYYGFSTSEYKPENFYKKLLLIFIRFILKFVPLSQGNLFGFFIEKPNLSKESFPWIKIINKRINLDKEWLKMNFKSKKNY